MQFALAHLMGHIIPHNQLDFFLEFLLIHLIVFDPQIFRSQYMQPELKVVLDKGLEVHK